MKTIVRIQFGSHLYGTSTPESDLDYKSVFIPAARDILLQRVRNSVSVHRDKAEGEKNLAGELDEESYSLQRFLQLVSEGQTVALDILFAPAWAWTEDSWEWQAIESNRDKLITRKSTAFLGYCRQQANKYGIRGSRVAAANEALALLELGLHKLGSLAKLQEMALDLAYITERNSHMQILDIEGATDIQGVRRSVRHWEVCNRKMPFTQTIKSAHEIIRRIVAEYGHRARQAQSNEGVDWKALSHAVRVGRQAIELLLCGFVQFPRPEAAHLFAIKTGQLPYQQVSEEIEELLEEVESAAKKSQLPENVDQTWIDDFVAGVHQNAILARI